MTRIELFYKYKLSFNNLGHKVVHETTFTCNDKEDSDSTNVEYYKRYIWYKEHNKKTGLHLL